MGNSFPLRTAETLADLGRLLAQTLDRELIAQKVAHGACLLLGARAAAVLQLAAETGGLTVLAGAGDAGLPAGTVLPEGAGPAGLAARERRPVATADVLEDARITLTPDLRRDLEAGDTRAALAVPMVVQDRVIGVLLVADEVGRLFGPEQVRLAQIFADQAGVAFENARLYEEAERRRRQAEAAERRSAFLAEASRVLASSLDYETTLAQVARLVVPGLADLCTVDVLESDGGVRRLAAAYVDPSHLDSSQPFPPSAAGPGTPYALARVLQSGRSEFVPDVDDRVLAGLIPDERHREALRALGLRSVMIVPLAARGKILGAITFCSVDPRRRYGAADLAFAEDLAGRAAQAIDNARLYRAAQEAGRAKDEFLATVSHELRTPLTAILGWAGVLRSRPGDPATLNEALEVIERNARVQAQIVSDLLDVSRIITGKLRLDVRPIDLTAVIHNATAAVRPAIEAKAIQLEMRLDPETAAFNGDADRLQQVVWNLLSNAVKFTPAGGHIEVWSARREGEVEIGVRDSGRGIDAAFLPYVFERFRQADAGATRTASGLGLGLAIVRHIVELHGGTVKADSPGPGRGATFTVRLPVAAAPAAEVPAEPRRPAAEPSAVEPACLDGTDVLVVEDDPDSRQLLAEILRRAGARVHVAASAAEGMSEIERRRFAVLVCDIAMPGEDGYSLIRRLRRTAPGRDLPAVALTAYARSDDRDRALAAGFDAHLAKPVEPTALVNTVARVARMARAA
ncbi:MAG TPA: GAF domain-containing protein [Candidatus Binatia bacterium]|nr:GAF domain-containing protein [Candidatus Binatia bacterium]